jgi:BirA family biotin operon repressor/biotin-[acetyl-CoA-carboxylase] ligase
MNALNLELLQQHSPWHEKVYVFETIDSTNTQALKLGEEGEAEGTIVIANEQMQGRGQFQRPWSSPAGMGLWMSLLVRPRIAPEMISGLSHFAVVALYDAIFKMGIIVNDLNIKEPNDLLIAGKKVAGVLVETRIGKSSFAVVGIGVNLFQQQKDFPMELREKVTSLQLAGSNHRIDFQNFVATLFQNLYHRYQQLLHEPLKLEAVWSSRL